MLLWRGFVKDRHFLTDHFNLYKHIFYTIFKFKWGDKNGPVEISFMLFRFSSGGKPANRISGNLMMFLLSAKSLMCLQNTLSRTGSPIPFIWPPLMVHKRRKSFRKSRRFHCWGGTLYMDPSSTQSCAIYTRPFRK
jgi:hypothetical protein